MHKQHHILKILKLVNFINLIFLRHILCTNFSRVAVNVYIRDQNDNYPEFEESIYEASVAENAPPGTTIAKVHAEDDDENNFGTRGIRYTSLGGSISHL